MRASVKKFNPSKLRRNVLAAAVVSVAMPAGVAFAQPTPTVITWTNTGLGDWDNTANWDLARTPNIATNNDWAMINNGGTASVSGSMAAEASMLDIGLQSGQSG